VEIAIVNTKGTLRIDLGWLVAVGLFAGWSCTLESTPQDLSLACLTNLKKIGQATLLYASENNDRIPPFVPSGIEWPQHRRGVHENPDGWRNALKTVGSIEDSTFVCPAYASAKLPEKAFEGEDPRKTGYRSLFLAQLGKMTNDRIHGWQVVDEKGLISLTLSQIELPRRIPHLGDLLFQVYRTDRNVIIGTHGDFEGRLFFDGHASFTLLRDPYVAGPNWFEQVR
jgi:hypothetical protein